MTPTRKVTAATLGAALSVIVLAILPGREDPELAGAIVTLSAFVAGWLVREG